MTALDDTAQQSDELAPPPEPFLSADRVLSDRPLADDAEDRFDYRDYADALTQIIDDPHTDTPLTLAISAPWGAGKTSLAMLMERRLREWPVERGDEPHVTCWFNAWLHDDAPHLGSALAADVALRANAQRPRWRRIVRPLAFTMLTREERWRRVLVVAGVGVAVAVVASRWSTGGVGMALVPDRVEGLDLLLGPTLGAVVGLVSVVWSRVFSIARSAADFVRNPVTSAAQGAMHTVRTQLGALIDEATRHRRRIVVFVDDLDRCTPEHALQVCETATQLLSRRGVVVVLLGDLDGIANAAGQRYRGDASSGTAYLEKLVQIEFALPPLTTQTLSKVTTTESPSGGGGPLVQTGQESRRHAQIVAGFGRVWRAVLARPLRTALVIYVLTVPLRSLPSSAVVGTGVWVGSLTALVLAVYGIGAPMRRWHRRLRARRSTRCVDECAREVGEGSISYSAIKEEVGDQARRKDISEALVKQRVQRYLANESFIRREAEEALLRYLPPRPRAAKRLVNRLRLQLAVAICRKLFEQAPDRGGTQSTPALTGAQLGKWVALSGRWRPLAQQIAKNPDLLARLEQSPEARRDYVIDSAEDSCLLRWLSDTPRLGDHVPVLVALTEPIPAPTSST